MTVPVLPSLVTETGIVAFLSTQNMELTHLLVNKSLQLLI